jgi:nucleotide sugar dehydrogenase
MAHYPGCGVGGHCIPVDPYYLIEYAAKSGFTHDFLTTARRINNRMPGFTVERLQDALNQVERSIKGSTIAVLGLSYKPNIDDCRESPSFHIIKILESKGATVRTFDPYVQGRSTHGTLENALEGVHAVLVATAHKEFLGLDYSRLAAQGVKVIVDGRNALNPGEVTNAGIVYRGIGK